MVEQQTQTFDYFTSHAKNWQIKATDQAYSVVENRHNAVLESMKSFPPNSSILDVGCGTGQLAIQASKLGWNALGIDFAQEMIDYCVSNNKEEKTTAKFICSSIFDYDAAPERFDVISAQGFIEYISLEQLDEFLDFCRSTVKKNGIVALGSRNRLFNLHSLNEFTELETALATTGDLILEGQIIQTAKNQQDAIEQLKVLKPRYTQPTVHPLTGVKVETRYQFSPADLIARLGNHGLQTRRIFPVHYHALPVALLAKKEFREVHNQFAKFAADNWIACHNLIPYSSSFVIEAQKA